MCERFERSRNIAFFRGPSNIIILIFHYVLLSVLLNFVSVILSRENFANRLNYPYYLFAIFNILLGGGSTPFVLFVRGFCSPLVTIYTYDAS